MNWIGTILGSTLGAALITALINHWSGRVNSRNLERFKADLSKELTRFSSLQQTRGEVIAEVYRLLRLTESDFAELTARLVREGEPTPATKWTKFGKSANQFVQYFHTKRIFLDEWLCRRIDDFENALRDGAISHEFWLRESTPSEDKRELYRKVDDIKKGLAEIRREIERQFRLILGVSDCPVLGEPNSGADA